MCESTLVPPLGMGWVTRSIGPRRRAEGSRDPELNDGNKGGPKRIAEPFRICAAKLSDIRLAEITAPLANHAPRLRFVHETQNKAAGVFRRLGGVDATYDFPTSLLKTGKCRQFARCEHG